MKSFLDEENRMEKISKIGDPLEILNSIINWEMFRVILKKHIVRKESNKGGRPPFDIVMMFKILVAIWDIAETTMQQKPDMIVGWAWKTVDIFIVRWYNWF